MVVGKKRTDCGKKICLSGVLGKKGRCEKRIVAGELYGSCWMAEDKVNNVRERGRCKIREGRMGGR